MKPGRAEGHRFYNEIADLPYQTCADVDVLFRRPRSICDLARRPNGKWSVWVIATLVLSSACVLLFQLADGRLESGRGGARVADEEQARPSSNPTHDP